MTDVVNKITGNFGLWQLRAVLIIYLCKIPSSWFMACVIFTAPAPYDDEFYCRPPSGTKVENVSAWVNTVHPPDASGIGIDHCHVYEDTFHNFSAPPVDLGYSIRPKETERSLIDCKEFEHAARTSYYSLVMQFDLVCSREIFVAWTQFWHLFGVLVGGIIATMMMNYISPRRVMFIGMLLQIPSGCLAGLIDNFSLHCLFRTTAAIFCALMFTAGGVIFSEISGGRYRTAVAILFDTFWAIGVILLPGLASFFVSWSYIYLGITFPTLILVYLYRWIPDAPRWLLRRGYTLEVEKILLESAEINDRLHAVPRNLTQELQLLADTLKSEPPPANWLKLWEGRRAKINLVAAHIAFAVYVTSFMGMLLNIRSFGRDYLVGNTIITAFSEIVGCFLALHFALKTKNKWLWAGIYNIIAGLIGCLGWVFPDYLPELARVSLWMLISSIGKAGVSVSQSMLFACSTELMPPEKKQIFFFSCLVWARVWLLSAPFINVLKNIDVAMSLSAFSVLNLLGGIATCCLGPEKKDPAAPVDGPTNGQENSGPRAVWTIPDTLERTKC